MILAIIFLLTDLFICGITYMVYGGKPVYSDGMILGVHIRREVQEEPELVEFLEGYRGEEDLCRGDSIGCGNLWIVLLVFLYIYDCMVYLVRCLSCRCSGSFVFESQKAV